ncbi:MAG: phosphoribosylformylglycinamidine synthase [Flavobacteriaceae bacterium]|nr:phosphoribosylformylglycinamidine synthase [Candidatus Onthonaster equi]
MKTHLTLFTTILLSVLSYAQIQNDSIVPIDSVTTTPTETRILPAKVSHAEPLYVDLMRDLGARKGEAEINVGFGVGSHRNYNEYYGFVEYEWAVADRLGLEVEVPFSFNKSNGDTKVPTAVPNNKVEGLKLATQYTFLVNEKRKMSLAVAYVHEFEFNTFKNLGHQGSVFTGMRMNPVFIGAKNFGNINTMLYTGPVIEHNYKEREVEVGATINASMMYVIPNSKNFIGVENNMDIDKDGFHYYVRPQVRLALKHNLLIGLVTGIPLTKHENSKLDVMTRIIWEP